MRQAIIDIALAAGRTVMEVYAGGLSEVANKADGSPVTEADSRSEAVILEALGRLSPEIPIVAEEEVAAGRVPVTIDRFLLVDALDGTREFLSRNGEFTVNIALVENGVPVIGVVYAPALGLLYAGGEGGAIKGAVRDGRVMTDCIAITVRDAPPQITAIGSRSHGSDDTSHWLRRYEVSRLIAAGSSLKFCRVADGEADIYPRLGRTMEWDTAAGHAVLVAAGGSVTHLNGTALMYNKRRQADDVDFANPHFVAYGDRQLTLRGALAGPL